MIGNAEITQGGPLYLASVDCPGLGSWVVAHALPGPVLLYPGASAALPDQGAIVGPVMAELQGAGIPVVVVDLDDLERMLGRAGALVMPGGDPFRLLAALHRPGLADRLRSRWSAGMPVAGQSAGAIVLGPGLAPIVLTSPFAPLPGQDLAGLGLTATLVLPHHDRRSRSARHRAAAVAYGTRVSLEALRDDEARVEHGRRWLIHQQGLVTRCARPGDGTLLSEVFRAAARRGWGSFLGRDALVRMPEEADRWEARIASPGDVCLVSEDAGGIVGFVLYRAIAADPASAAAGHPEAALGEIDLLYTHPRAWGRGIGRRLLDRATFALLASGCREAFLWTEARNERALRLYTRGGWFADGVSESREYLGVAIRNERLWLDLRRWGGGGPD